MILGNMMHQYRMLCTVNLQHELNAIQRDFPTIYNKKADYSVTVETLRMFNRIVKK